MTRIILVRHGETDWNAEKRYLGHSDIELSKTGIRQAEFVAERLALEQVHAVYSSDLKRAVVTAQYIANKHNLPVYTHNGFREINFGRWEGATYKQIMADQPKILTAIYQGHSEVSMPEGESFQTVQKRAIDALQECLCRHMGQTTVIVSHGGTLAAILCRELGKSLSEIWSIKQDCTALSIIKYDHCGKGEVIVINDQAHLSKVVENIT